MSTFPLIIPRRGGLCLWVFECYAKGVKDDARRTPRQKTASQLRRRTASVEELLDRGFFIFAGLAALWLATLLFLEGWGVEWTYWVYFVVFWMVIAYLGLPRLHRILTTIYVPDYFIGRTRTSDGLLGDPVNVAVRGSEAQVHKAMLAAGWTLADDITVRSSWKIGLAILLRRSYASAPVSALYLFGRRQDFSYQKQVDGSPGKRHHVRFWHCPSGWLLPGGHQVDWLADATYDTATGFSWFTLQLTHRIDENTDIERDFVVESMLETNEAASMTLLEDYSTGYHSRNGGGDKIITDGNLPVVELGQVEASATLPQRPGYIFDKTLLREGGVFVNPVELGEALWDKRPLQLVASGALVAAIVAMEVFGAVQELLVSSMNVGGLLLGLAAVIAEVVLVLLVLRGSNTARMSLLLLASFFIIKTAVQHFFFEQPVIFGNSLVSSSLHIGLLLALSSDSARRFTNRTT